MGTSFSFAYSTSFTISLITLAGTPPTRGLSDTSFVTAAPAVIGEVREPLLADERRLLLEERCPVRSGGALFLFPDYPTNGTTPSTATAGVMTLSPLSMSMRV